MSKRLKNVLPFHVFARRRQVIVLYRSMIRAAKKVEDEALSTSLVSQISTGFRQNRDLKDPFSLKSALQEANSQLKQLDSMSGGSYDSDSWINQSEPDDERGRIGQGWPFSKD